MTTVAFISIISFYLPPPHPKTVWHDFRKQKRFLSLKKEKIIKNPEKCVKCHVFALFRSRKKTSKTKNKKLCWHGFKKKSIFSVWLSFA